MFRKEYTAQGGPGTEITDAIPSLDMRPVLALFSPEDAFLRIESCSACGGHLEIVTKETKRVARLTKRIRYLVARDERVARTSDMRCPFLPWFTVDAVATVPLWLQGSFSTYRQLMLRVK